MIKLNLGSGGQRFDEYTNIDLFDGPEIDMVMDATDLSHFQDNSVDDIRAHHLIEHLTYYQAEKAFNEWCRVLKPGSLLLIECPDVLRYCQAFIDEPENRWCGIPPGKDTPLPRYGHALIQGLFGHAGGVEHPVVYGFGPLPHLSQVHKSGWTADYLIKWLKIAGFSRFEDKTEGLILRVLAWK